MVLYRSEVSLPGYYTPIYILCNQFIKSVALRGVTVINPEVLFWEKRLCHSYSGQN